jgi:acyl carrier protein
MMELSTCPANRGVLAIGQVGDCPMTTEIAPNDIEARVIRVIAETQKIPVESVTVDKSFQDLKIDSLDGINVVFGLESEFDISIPDDGLENLRSVRDAIEGVRKLVEQKVSAN